MKSGWGAFIIVVLHFVKWHYTRFNLNASLRGETFEVFETSKVSIAARVMENLPALVSGQFFHIYNRGINRENIFIEERNYAYFMDLYTQHVEPVADTFAYCLLKNHFHLLVRIKESSEVASRPSRFLETSKVLNPTQQFSNFLNAYAKAINKTYNRTGSLFQGRFGRIPVTTDGYLVTLVHYIHFNPQKHGFVSDFREWWHSSYHGLYSNKPTRLKRDELLEWFSGRKQYVEFHNNRVAETKIANLIVGDSD